MAECSQLTQPGVVNLEATQRGGERDVGGGCQGTCGDRMPEVMARPPVFCLWSLRKGKSGQSERLLLHELFDLHARTQALCSALHDKTSQTLVRGLTAHLGACAAGMNDAAQELPTLGCTCPASLLKLQDWSVLPSGLSGCRTAWEAPHQWCRVRSVDCCAECGCM